MKRLTIILTFCAAMLLIGGATLTGCAEIGDIPILKSELDIVTVDSEPPVESERAADTAAPADTIELPVELLTEAETEPEPEPIFDHNADAFADGTISVNNSDFVIPQAQIDAYFADAAEYEFRYSFIAIDLNSDMSFGYNCDEKFATASTVKTGFTLWALKDIAAGNSSLSDTVTYERKHYVAGTGEVRKSPFGTEFTVKELIYNALVYSDNIAYYMLLDHFGYDGYNAMMTEMGCTHQLADGERWGKISARELALIWLEVYRFKDSGSEGAFMWDCLTHNYYNEIDFALNDYAKRRGYDLIAHKSGWSDYGFHDSGIVCDAEQPYLIVVMTGTYVRTYLFLDTVLYVDKIMKLYWEWQANG